MPVARRNTLSKSERLHGRNAVENLFGKAKRSSMVVFPLRAVYTLADSGTDAEESVRMLVSVSKRHFKRAVKRNRAKRQVREAYRKNKHALQDTVAGMAGCTLSVAFVWLSDEQQSTEEVEKSVCALITRIGERIRHIYEGREKEPAENP